MESIQAHSGRAAAFTALAPVAWGSTYFVTEHFLPPGRPLFSAAVRALPVGLVLLAVVRELPRGQWWWRSAVLGTLNVGAFFPLIFLAGYHLPGGVAAVLTATSPLAVMVIAWALIAERPAALSLGAGGLGLLGVVLLVLTGGPELSWIGVAASLGAVLISSVGYVLVKRWRPPVPMLTFVSWQLLAGGLVLTPLALLVEGAPPTLDGRNLVGFAYLLTFGTGLAYLAWFTGLRALPAGTVALIGLLNPVVGTLLGVLVAGESLGAAQGLGIMLVLGSVLLGQPAIQARLRRPTAAAQNGRGGRADSECVPAA